MQEKGARFAATSPDAYHFHLSFKGEAMTKLLAIVGTLCIACAAQAAQQKGQMQQQATDPGKVNQCVQACVQRAAAARGKAKCHERCATGTFQR